jgi:aspartyl-tRNA(Asn)/glutamyl-tRNA(Gln) amidotransferase subunit A
VAEKPLHDLSIAEAGAAMRSGGLTSSALTEHSLARIDLLNPKINAFVTVTAERARTDAAAADADFARGVDRGPLQGIPYGLKDIYDTAGIQTACHSKLRLDHVPQKDSAVAEKLAAQGAVLLGKLTTNEFALGNPDPDAPFPPALNPWNIDYSPGGSSSGSGAAVAAGLVRLAMGSDTGASIRGPASFCGIIGLKPTFGLISRRGVFPLSPSLDHCGPLTKSVEDAALAMEAVAGHDPHDPASARVPPPQFRGLLNAGVKGLRIGVPRHFYRGAKGLSGEADAAIERSLRKLRDLGAIVSDIVLPDYASFVACGRVIMYTEAFAIHEKDFRNRPRDFGFSTYMRMIMGAFTTGADMVQALRLRRELTEAVNRQFRNCDAIVTATALGPAPKMNLPGDWSMPSDSPMQCIPFNVTGHPAIAVPTGFSSSGLPLALQIVAKHFDEPMVLRIGAALEKENPVLSRWPDLAVRREERGAAPVR